MAEFDRTESSYIENKIEQESKLLELGRVVRVFEHTAPDDDSNHEVNVILRDEDKERRRVPILNNTAGSIQPPANGDMVVVGFLDGSGEAPVVLGQLYNAQQRALLGKENIYRLRRGDLYLEAHPDGDWIRMAHKSADDAEPTSEVEIKDNGDVDIYGDRVRINNAEQIIQVTQSADLAEGGANEHNVNQSAWTVVPWDQQGNIVDDSYIFDGSEKITIQETGTYEVYSNLYYQSTDASSKFSVKVRYTKNGNPLFGMSNNGYISNQSNDEESSTTFKNIYQFEQGDEIRVESQSEAASGEVYPVEDASLFQIQRLQR
jgi:hypothetical protein